ncbi:unnamed protein product [Discosporangium mesarthrocarpum]
MPSHQLQSMTRCRRKRGRRIGCLPVVTLASNLFSDVSCCRTNMVGVASFVSSLGPLSAKGGSCRLPLVPWNVQVPSTTRKRCRRKCWNVLLQSMSGSSKGDPPNAVDVELKPEGEDGVRRLRHSLDGEEGEREVEGKGDPEIQTVEDLVKLLQQSDDPVWDLIRFEGGVATKQSRVSSILHGSVLARTSLADAVTYDISNKMATTFLGSNELNLLVADMFEECPDMSAIVAEDLLATAMGDPSVPDVLTVLLFHKGFTALSTYRLAHRLWEARRRTLARYLQSVTSEVCAADIHPACRIGKGVHLSSGCDIVIGETAVVGDEVCLLQGVTLGGTGKNTGDRHPKVARGVHIGAGCSVLGNIAIGEGARVEAAAVVVKPVAPYTISQGVPAKTISFIVCDPFSLEDNFKHKPRKIFITY